MILLQGIGGISPSSLSAKQLVSSTEMAATLGCLREPIQAHAETALWARIKPHFLEIDIQCQNWFFKIKCDRELAPGGFWNT